MQSPPSMIQEKPRSLETSGNGQPQDQSHTNQFNPPLPSAEEPESGGAEPSMQMATLVKELEGDGISASDIRKLQDGGFYTIISIAHATLREVAAVKGISEAKAKQLQEAASKHVDMGFTTAAETYLRQESLITITTGSKMLDAILKGGVETGSLTEIYGEFRTGKSQICHQLAVTCQLPVYMGGGEGRCMLIDTEGTFRVSRVVSIARRYGLDETITTKNIAYGRCYNTDHVLKLLEDAGKLMSKSRFAIIIVDSIMALLRSEFGGRGELSARQMVLKQILRKLRNLADEFGVAIVYTNQVMAQVEGTPFASDPKKPIGGNILAHATTTRLQFKKGRGCKRIVRICDSPCLPESECQFGIYEDGIDDPRDTDGGSDMDN